MKPEQSVIILDPPWWQCENGCEFRCGENKPKTCPVCRSAKVEIVINIDDRLRTKVIRGKSNA